MYVRTGRRRSLPAGRKASRDGDRFHLHGLNRGGTSLWLTDWPVDPTDAAKIYVFCGSNDATLLISEDYGEKHLKPSM